MYEPANTSQGRGRDPRKGDVHVISAVRARHRLADASQGTSCGRRPGNQRQNPRVQQMPATLSSGLRLLAIQFRPTSTAQSRRLVARRTFAKMSVERPRSRLGRNAIIRDHLITRLALRCADWNNLIAARGFRNRFTCDRPRLFCPRR